MSTPLIPPSFLFNVSVPCLYLKASWTDEGVRLPPKYKLPCLHAELADGQEYADVRLAWNEDGLFLNVDVSGKSNKPWCVDKRIDDSDRIALLIDTRDTKTVHRATKFCHHLAVLPTGRGNKVGVPFVSQQPMRSTSAATPALSDSTWKAVSELRDDGYWMSVFLSSKALTGYDTSEYSNLGFTYLVNDRELGLQTFNQSIELPFANDPSLWASLQLTKT